MWNCHSWPLDVSTSMKLPFLTILSSCVYQYSRHLCLITWMSICQSMFICQVWCSGIQGIYSWFSRGSISQSRFICQFLCTGIKGISALFPGGSIHQSYVCLPSVVYWYARHLCSICGGSICQSMFVCQVLCTGIQGIYALFVGGPSAKVCPHLPSVVYWHFKASMLYSGGSISQSRFICQVWCSGIQGINSQFTGGSICQSRFVCQVLRTSIQGNYSC